MMHTKVTTVPTLYYSAASPSFSSFSVLALLSATAYIISHHPVGRHQASGPKSEASTHHSAGPVLAD